jgi:hypothetical protein
MGDSAGSTGVLSAHGLFQNRDFPWLLDGRQQTIFAQNGHA